MLVAVPQLVASTLLVIGGSVFKKSWEASKRNQLFALAVFCFVEAGSVCLVLLSANTSLAATTTILVAVCFAVALFAKPFAQLWKRRHSIQKKPSLSTGKF